MSLTTGNRGYGFGIPYEPYSVNKFPPGHGWATFMKPVKLPLGYAWSRFYQAYPVQPPRLPRVGEKMSPVDCALWAARRSYWGASNMGPVC